MIAPWLPRVAARHTLRHLEHASISDQALLVGHQYVRGYTTAPKHPEKKNKRALNCKGARLVPYQHIGRSYCRYFARAQTPAIRCGTRRYNDGVRARICEKCITAYRSCDKSCSWRARPWLNCYGKTTEGSSDQFGRPLRQSICRYSIIAKS